MHNISPKDFIENLYQVQKQIEQVKLDSKPKDIFLRVTKSGEIKVEQKKSGFQRVFQRIELAFSKEKKKEYQVHEAIHQLLYDFAQLNNDVNFENDLEQVVDILKKDSPELTKEDLKTSIENATKTLNTLCEKVLTNKKNTSLSLFSLPWENKNQLENAKTVLTTASSSMNERKFAHLFIAEFHSLNKNDRKELVHWYRDQRETSNTSQKIFINAAAKIDHILFKKMSVDSLGLFVLTKIEKTHLLEDSSPSLETAKMVLSQAVSDPKCKSTHFAFLFIQQLHSLEKNDQKDLVKWYKEQETGTNSSEKFTKAFQKVLFFLSHLKDSDTLTLINTARKESPSPTQPKVTEKSIQKKESVQTPTNEPPFPIHSEVTEEIILQKEPAQTSTNEQASSMLSEATEEAIPQVVFPGNLVQELEKKTKAMQSVMEKTEALTSVFNKIAVPESEKTKALEAIANTLNMEINPPLRIASQQLFINFLQGLQRGVSYEKLTPEQKKQFEIFIGIFTEKEQELIQSRVPYFYHLERGFITETVTNTLHELNTLSFPEEEREKKQQTIETHFRRFLTKIATQSYQELSEDDKTLLNTFLGTVHIHEELNQEFPQLAKLIQQDKEEKEKIFTGFILRIEQSLKSPELQQKYFPGSSKDSLQNIQERVFEQFIQVIQNTPYEELSITQKQQLLVLLETTSQKFQENLAQNFPSFIKFRTALFFDQMNSLENMCFVLTDKKNIPSIQKFAEQIVNEDLLESAFNITSMLCRFCKNPHIIENKELSGVNTIDILQEFHKALFENFTAKIENQNFYDLSSDERALFCIFLESLSDTNLSEDTVFTIKSFMLDILDIITEIEEVAYEELSEDLQLDFQILYRILPDDYKQDLSSSQKTFFQLESSLLVNTQYTPKEFFNLFKDDVSSKKKESLSGYIVDNGLFSNTLPIYEVLSSFNLHPERFSKEEQEVVKGFANTLLFTFLESLPGEIAFGTSKQATGQSGINPEINTFTKEEQAFFVLCYQIVDEEQKESLRLLFDSYIPLTESSGFKKMLESEELKKITAQTFGLQNRIDTVMEQERTKLESIEKTIQAQQSYKKLLHHIQINQNIYNYENPLQYQSIQDLQQHKSPLHKALDADDFQAMALLIESGADLLQTRNEETIFQIILSSGNNINPRRARIIDLLYNKGLFSTETFIKFIRTISIDPREFGGESKGEEWLETLIEKIVTKENVHSICEALKSNKQILTRDSIIQNLLKKEV